jgi:hypothetical protein
VARRLAPLVLAALLSPGLVACAATLDAGEVATNAEDALEAEVGSRPEISCPEDVEAKVGAETRCVLTAGDDPAEYGVTITVTAVDGSDAEFDIVVDEQPAGGGQ